MNRKHKLGNYRLLCLSLGEPCVQVDVSPTLLLTDLASLLVRDTDLRCVDFYEAPTPVSVTLRDLDA